MGLFKGRSGGRGGGGELCGPGRAAVGGRRRAGRGRGGPFRVEGRGVRG